MARHESESPTELELDILKVLWDSAPLLVRDVRERLKERGRPLAHSSVITMLNIMVRKNYVGRRKQGNAFLFFPKVERNQVAEGFVGDVVSRLFEGSASAMVLNVLETADLDAEELAEIRRLIARKSKEQS